MPTSRLNEDDPTFGEINLLLRTLRALDERGLILVLGAFAEESLAELLKVYMRPGASKPLLEGFNAPLGTLSARIGAAYALGLITKGQFEDLQRLRKIRNAFSHTWKPISFDDPFIADHINNISYSMADDDFPESPIEKVRTCMAHLLVELQVTGSQIVKRKLGARVIGSRLVSGKQGTIDEQLGLASENLDRITAEYPVSKRDRRAFLEAAHERWISRLTILQAQAPPDREGDVRALLTRYGKARFGKAWSE